MLYLTAGLRPLNWHRTHSDPIPVSRNAETLTFLLTYTMTELQSSLSISLRATDIVLSCTICQETLSSIYAEDDANRGLRKSEDSRDGRVTKLWLTECAHLTCGKHLKGGGDSSYALLVSTIVTLMEIVVGVPFHSDQQVPRAPCPLCTIEKNDASEKSLFFVNGTSKGEYDSNIPDAYFQTPPLEFIGGDTGFEALRVGKPPF